MSAFYNRIVGIVFAFFCVFGGACAQEHSTSTTPQDSQAFDADYRIEALTSIDGEVRTLTFRAGADSGTIGGSGGGLGTKDITVEGAPVAAQSASMTDLARIAISECGVRRMPALGPNAKFDAVMNYSCLATQFVSSTAWRFGTGSSDPAPTGAGIANRLSCTADNNIPFLFFQNEPVTCDQALQYEEVLVCAASKLQQLADAEKPTVWTNGFNGLLYTPNTGAQRLDLNGLQDPVASVPPVTFRIVQPKDKFLVRDMAMELLSYVPLLDQMPMKIGATAERRTCSQLYSQAFTATPTTLPNVDVANAAYNIPAPNSVALSAVQLYYPQIEVAADGSSIDWRKTAQRHMEMEAANLRAAQQMLRELVEKNVYGALAGAAQKAATLPPTERGKALWASQADGNSISEISRNLFGRLGTLGMGSPAAGQLVSNANCMRTDLNPSSTTVDWLLPQNAWTATGSGGFRARGNDLPLRNRKGLLAESFLAKSKVIFAATETPNVVREGMRSRLRLSMAADIGITPSAFDSSLGVSRLNNALDGLSDQNLMIARDRQSAQFQSLSNSSSSMSLTTLSAIGLAPTGTGPWDINTTGERSAYEGDLMAPMAGVQMASECTGTVATPPAGWMEVGQQSEIVKGNPIVSLTLANAATTSSGRSAGFFSPRDRSYQFQDVFAVGQAIRDRLVRLRQYGDDASMGATTDEDVRARSGALFEADGWAGGGRVIVMPGATTGAAFMVTLMDVDMKELGFPDDILSATQLDIINSLAFAIAPTAAADGDLSTVAQCLSGSRKARCPSTAPTYLWKASSATPLTIVQPSAAEKRLGHLRASYTLTFPTVGPVAPGMPTAVAGATPVAIAQLPKAFIRIGGTQTTKAAGQVLGATRSVGTWTDGRDHVTTFAISPLRRKLLEAVFGLPKTSESLTNTLADTREYCIPGMPRDVYVPLENELTSDGDQYESSWKSYLNTAKEAAAKADTLGRDLVEIGTRREERSEGAYDRIETMVAGPVDKECLENAGTGELEVSKCSDAIKAVLQQQKVDVAFLSTDPGEGLALSDGAGRRAKLQATLQCPASGTSLETDVCKKLRGGANAILVTADDKLPTWKRPDTTNVYYYALGLVSAPKVPTPNMSDCNNPSADLNYYLRPGDRLERWAASDDVVRRAMYSARMTVGADADFKIESNGATFVDSSDQALRFPAPTVTATSTPRFWPGCLRDGAPASSCGLLPGQTDGNSALNKALNATFRSTPCDGGALGTCNGASPAAELTGIRWRMMGALWTANALAGQQPDGAFDLYIPAVNFPANAAGTCALPSTVYGPARFTLSGSNYSLTGTPQDITAQDSALMVGSGSPMVAVNANYAAMPTAVGELPAWYRGIYQASTAMARPTFDDCFRVGAGAGLTYVHVRAHNTGLTSDTSYLRDWMNTGAAGVTGQGLTLEGWRTLANRTSDPNFPIAIAAVKTFWAGGNPSADFYLDRFSPFYGMLASQWRGLSFFGEGSTTLGEEYPSAFRWHGSSGSPIYKAVTQVAAYGDHSGDRANWGGAAFGPGEGRPTLQPPNFRARFFANSLAPMGAADAAREFAEATAMACVLSTNTPLGDDTSALPTITSDAQLSLVDAWLATKVQNGVRSVAAMNVENVPVSIIDAVRTNGVGAGQSKGQTAIASIEAATALRAIATSYNNVVKAGIDSRGELQSLNGNLRLIDRKKDSTNASGDLRAAQQVSSVLSSIGSGLTSLATGGPGAVMGAISAGLSIASAASVSGASASLTAAELAALDQERQNAYGTSSRALAQYQKNQGDALADLRDKVSNLQIKLLTLEGQKRELQSALARASGSGAWACQDASGRDITCRSFVGAVLNVRYSATRIRYEKALQNARAAAYLARRAIEQRLGVRLDQFENNIGPLEAPVKWMDRVCTMQGVDFKTLKYETSSTDPAQKKAWEELRGQEYANTFIGDYVDLLASFVQYYNVAYPSQDGSDASLLSMREDITRQGGPCEGPSTNRLANSEAMSSPDEGPANQDNTWQLHACGNTSTKCAQASEWRPEPNTSSAPARGTWLSTRAHRTATEPPEEGIVGPSGFMSQSVLLNAGKYALSFKDGALELATGLATNAVVGSYRVTVFDESSAIVATQTFTPLAGSVLTAGQTTTRLLATAARTLRFAVANSGRYRIAFSPSTGPTTDGSVLIFEPQLERDDINQAPSKYQATSSKGTSQSTSCASTPDQLRAKFTRKCETTNQGTRCFYESNDPFTIDTTTLSINGQSLAEKMSASNYNYRHVDFALNLVGTGLRSCDENPTPGCYSSGTIEYDLVHEANQVGILGYDNEARRFDFGEGAVRHGKALTAERYLSLPLSGADSAILAQTGFTKTELRGRPLDGRYRMRIYESPALRWTQLEDVQLLFKYRYWSRVNSPSQF